MQPSATEQLAVLTALQKAVRERLDEVRAEADADLIAAYDEDGVTKKVLKVGGIKVGDYLLTFTKEDWRIIDVEAFNDFALSYGFARETYAIRPECMDRAIGLIAEHAPELLHREVEIEANWQRYVDYRGGLPMFLDSNEMVPGIAYVVPQVKCSQVRGCKPDDVMPVLQRLGGLDRLLLGAPQNSAADSNATELTETFE